MCFSSGCNYWDCSSVHCSWLNVCVCRYLHDEMNHKKKQEFDETGWELVPTTPDTPQQANGSDCGVFTSIFADYLSRDQVRGLLCPALDGCPY